VRTELFYELRKIILIASLVFLIVLAVLYYLSVNYNLDFRGILYGGLLSYVNFTAGISVLASALRKPGTQFMLMAFGSMAVRLFVLTGLVVLGLLLYKFDRFVFVFVFFFFYFSFLIVEIFFLLYLQKKIKSGKKNIII
jgi:hypothetical protein